MNKNIERLTNGIIKENPTFVLMLGMCPTLAVTTSAMNGLGMGLSTTVVLLVSNMVISMLRKIIPDRVRVPAFIVVVASIVTMVQFLLQGFVPALYASLGIYIPLIVVNCIILGRAESYASKNPVVPSIFDGIGMGLGFTLGLTLIGIVREILGAGQIFGKQILPLADEAAGKAGYTPITIFVLAPGAFFVLAVLVAVMNVVRAKAEAKGKPLPAAQGCLAGDCSSCEMSACTGKSTVSATEVKKVDENKASEKKAVEKKTKEKQVDEKQVEEPKATSDDNKE
ncbi:MAG: electron transport complex subunit E [Lachnospiraceae bacterium]|nr:electron transport complex subunit E [Lachnospiraceae bacterium]